jgi:hypothetical protein
MVWARNITAHELFSALVMRHAGLSPHVLDHAASAGIDAIVSTGLYVLDEHGLPTKKLSPRAPAGGL